MKDSGPGESERDRRCQPSLTDRVAEELKVPPSQFTWSLARRPNYSERLPELWSTFMNSVARGLRMEGSNGKLTS